MKKAILLSLICSLGYSFNLHSQSIPTYIPSNGLVGWWPFNGNANDLSGNNNNGVISGATTTTDRFGNVNSSYLFDGIDDYISISDNNALSFGSGEFTFSLWFLCNSVPSSCTSTSPYLIGQTDNLTGGNANGYFIGRYCNNNIRFITQDQVAFPNNSLVLEPQTTITTSEWYHVTITKSGNVWTMYWNGNPVSTSTDSRSISDPIANLIIGNSNIGLANPSHNGKIDDIGIQPCIVTTRDFGALPIQ